MFNFTLGRLPFEIVCEQYYEPVRIAYKNRFGQFDFINFYKRHNNIFNTEQKLYQPQLGTWESSTLSYNQFQTKQQRYIVDSTETLQCNTDWLKGDGYNELMKQLLVADEIYWCYDQTNNLVKPLTIRTNSLQFKTGVNDKLIQYTIDFDLGQPYKLIF
jgi:maltooligosyltrehalose synthase